jgi:FtsZ-binding cell division protein ZapB
MQKEIDDLKEKNSDLKDRTVPGEYKDFEYVCQKV